MKLSVQFLNAKHAKRVIARAVACGAVLGLPGCFIPNLRPAQTGVAVPGTYDGTPAGLTNGSFSGSATTENSAQLRVDEFYHDPVLTRLICQAVATNRDLKTLEEEIQIAQAQILGRRGAFLPLIGFRADAGTTRYSKYTLEGASRQDDPYLLDPVKHLPNPTPNFLFGINYLIPLDIWRELRNARDAAIQRYFAAIERRNDLLTRLVADVAQNYYGLMALDKRLETLNRIIARQEASLKAAQALFERARGTTLGIRRFEAEVRKNQSERLIVRQEIVETENRINRLRGLMPQPVERNSAGFYDLTINALKVGVPAQLLLNRPDIRQAEREVAAAGLEVKVARARFFPRVDITGTVGTSVFNPKYLFNPESFLFNAAGELTAPLINKAAIRADYRTANAQQLEAVYNYQRTIINAVVEVVNQMSAVENYSRSIAIKREQLQALESAVKVAQNLFNNPRPGEKGEVDYLDVLTTQRDLLDATTVFINTKRQQLSAIVSVYQALGGGTSILCPPPDGQPGTPGPQQLPDAYPLPAPPKEMEPPQPPPQAEPQPLPAPPKEKPKEKDAPGLPRLPEVRLPPAPPELPKEKGTP
jgi:NodT family efflux transporter outer membrane factor (OMF) lipoprotein